MFAVKRGGSDELYYIHPDHLGTPRAITRESDNQVVWRWDNTEPFGNSAPNEDPSNLRVFAYNLRFPGQYFDSETGLSYNYFRDYDPSIGRYVQSDPIGLRAGVNTFAYAFDRPLNSSDFFGLDVNVCFYAPIKTIAWSDASRIELTFRGLTTW
jgi:RHS repeat-associated protein